MNIHFIWFGSKPHPELTAKIAAKMRYLNTMFSQTALLTFRLCTTSDLISQLESTFKGEHIGGLRLQIDNVENEFTKLPSSSIDPITAEDIGALRTFFYKGSIGPIANKALAADIIKYTVLLNL